MENGNLSQGGGNDPSGFLSEIIGSSVTVKLNSGLVYKGISSLLASHPLLSYSSDIYYGYLTDDFDRRTSSN